MPLNNAQITEIEDILTQSLRNKFAHYNPEPASMPFHTRLLGKDRMALFSFIHSLNTNFGTSIFEPVAVALAKTQFKTAEKQQIAGTHISTEAQKVIQTIMDDLSTARKMPDKRNEIEQIRNVCQKGEMREVKPTKVDVKLISKNNEIYLIDIKAAKPNAGEFKGFKRTLLEWVAVTLADNPNAHVHTLIAIPYNPYEPQEYNRWTMRGMIDLDNELKVAKECWDFLGGQGAYDTLLDIFEKVGIELRPEIDDYFLRYR
ncbi:MAG: TdeIII family type II restriction endonuclease [Treponema phagedenis]|uniref:TdeIII family type II restriction endonuclease n=1 Tax=Treponema phagedenis TaxID=162 RepID=UPI00313418F0